MQVSERPAKPVPADVPVERPYWQSCREHAMQIQRCDDCGNYRFYPGYVCDRCGSSALTWTPVSGRGTVYSNTVIRRRGSAAFDSPYSWALIELDEGVVMASNVVDCPVEDVHIGLRVEVVYDEVSSDWTIPRFRPAPEGPS